MLNLFPTVGIDIGSFAVKVIELSGKSKKTLRAIGLELLPEGIVTNGIIQDEDTLKDIIISIFRKLKISLAGRPVAVSLGGEGVHVKRINIDSEQGDIEDTINYEAEQYFSTDIEDIYYKYQILQKMPNSTMTPVILVGASRSKVDQYIAMLKDIELKPVVADCAVLSLLNMFDYNFPAANAVVGIINIGANLTQIIFSWNGQYLYSKEIQGGGALYTTQLMDMLGLNYENAESLKISASHSVESASEETKKVFSDINAEIVEQIKSVIDEFNEISEFTNNNLTLQYLFITGGSAKVLGLERDLASAVKIPVSLLNPFRKVNIPRNFDMNYLLAQGHLYGVAFGLGLRYPKDDI